MKWDFWVCGCLCGVTFVQCNKQCLYSVMFECDICDIYEFIFVGNYISDAKQYASSKDLFLFQ